jgi:tRNA C32,U32 (ribose-2'-O)-methylase TrmJ
VLLAGYELLTARLARDEEMPRLKPRETRPPRRDVPSPAEEQDELFNHLREAFLAIGYAYPHTVDPMIRSYRELFSRARLYSRETKMLRGLARQMQWVAENRAELED